MKSKYFNVNSVSESNSLKSVWTENKTFEWSSESKEMIYFSSFLRNEILFFFPISKLLLTVKPTWQPTGQKDQWIMWPGWQVMNERVWIRKQAIGEGVGRWPEDIQSDILQPSWFPSRGRFGRTWPDLFQVSDSLPTSLRCSETRFWCCVHCRLFLLANHTFIC